MQVTCARRGRACSLSTLARALSFPALSTDIAQGVTKVAGMPLRGVTAQRPIARGAVLAQVPLAACLHGSTAASLVAGLARSAGEGARHEDAVAAVAAVARTLPTDGRSALVPLTSRDALLITVALAALRCSALQQPPPPSLPADARAFVPWIRALPPRMPPLGDVLQRALEEHAGGDAADAAVGGGPSPQVARRFYNGKRLATAAADRAGAESDAVLDSSLQRVLDMTRGLNEEVLPPLVPILWRLLAPVGGGGAAAIRDDAAMLEALEWAHFMLRSRAVNCHFREGASDGHGHDGVAPALVPVLDMINHSSTAPNVTFRGTTAAARDQGHITITTTRPVAAGEELAMNYGHFRQRLALLGAAPGADAAEDGDGISALPQRQRNAAAVDRAVQRLYDEQRFVLLDRGSAHQAADLAADTRAMHAAAPETQEPDSVAARRAEALDVAEWIFDFGFAKSQRELAFEASCAWSATLTARIARLTDVRRRGRPGEFVVGVPEGLRALHEERQALQRRRYGGQHAVFPPINRGAGAGSAASGSSDGGVVRGVRSTRGVNE